MSNSRRKPPAAPEPPSVPLEPPLMVGESRALIQVLVRAQALAALSRPILIEGPTGSGKDLVARYLYFLSGLTGKYQALNCAALPPDLADSELFGYERGAFTGAEESHAGLVEAADRGVLFLDEVAELSRTSQIKLLRFLQDGTFRRLGSSIERKVQVRVLAATNKNLEELVTQGLVQQDLYYRLAALKIEVPPLRARGRDVLHIARFYLRRDPDLRERNLELSASARQVLCEHDWPGNIRELQSALIEAAVLVTDNTIQGAHLERVLRRSRREVAQPEDLIGIFMPGKVYDSKVLRTISGYSHGTFYRRLAALQQTGVIERVGQGTQAGYRLVTSGPRGEGQEGSLERGGTPASSRRSIILKLCDIEEGKTSGELAVACDVSTRAISRDLQALAHAGLLEVLKAGKQRRYRTAMSATLPRHPLE